MNSPITIDLSVDCGTGKLLAKFTNRGAEPLLLGYIDEIHDVVIENELGERAEFYLTSCFDAEMETFDLDAGAELTCKANVGAEFIFPRSGMYTAQVSYDTSRKTAKYARAVDEVRAQSNRVSFPIELPAEGAGA